MQETDPSNDRNEDDALLSAAQSTLAILAGGEGSRMGRPKDHLTIGGVPILEFLLSQFNWPGPTLLIVAPGRALPIGHERFDQVATDPIPGEGPMRGTLTALEAMSTPCAIVATLDMPRIERPHALWLLSELAALPALQGVMSMRSASSKHPDRIEPFPIALAKAARLQLQALLEHGERSMHTLLSTEGFIAHPAPVVWPDDVWMNLNWPDDWRRFEAERAARKI